MWSKVGFVYLLSYVLAFIIVLPYVDYSQSIQNPAMCTVTSNLLPNPENPLNKGLSASALYIISGYSLIRAMIVREPKMNDYAKIVMYGYHREFSAWSGMNLTCSGYGFELPYAVKSFGLNVPPDPFFNAVHKTSC